MTGIERIADERERQVELGWSRSHDNEHDDGSLVRAALMYCVQGLPARKIALADIYWPWEVDIEKVLTDDPIRNLEKAGALIAAEIDRLSGGES